MRKPSAGRIAQQTWPAVVLGLVTLCAGLWIFRAVPPLNENIRDYAYLACDLGWLLLAVGGIIIGRALAGPLAGSFPGAGRRWFGGGLLALTLLLAAGLYADRVLATKTGLIHGVRAFWLDDDMMISMRYARNLAHGAGLVWNAGEPPVEGYTNFLWALVMTLPHWAGIPPLQTSAVMLALNGIGLLATLILAWRVGRRIGLGLAERWLAVLLLVLNRWVLYWAVAGSETVLLGLVTLVLAERFLATRRRRPLGWGTGLLLGLLGLVRADALVLVAVFLLLWWGLSRVGRTRRLAWLPALLIPAAQFLGRHAYYGEWFPNTYFLRVMGVPTRGMMGVYYSSYFALLFGGVLILLLLAMLLARRPVARGLGLLPLAGLAYSAYAGGDELPELRFLAPLVPLMLLLAVEGGQSSAEDPAGPPCLCARFAFRRAGADHGAGFLPLAGPAARVSRVGTVRAGRRNSRMCGSGCC